MKVLILRKRSQFHESCFHVCSYHNCNFWGAGKKVLYGKRSHRKQRSFGISHCDFMNYIGTINLRQEQGIMDYSATDFPDNTQKAKERRSKS